MSWIPDTEGDEEFARMLQAQYDNAEASELDLMR